MKYNNLVRETSWHHHNITGALEHSYRPDVLHTQRHKIRPSKEDGFVLDDVECAESISGLYISEINHNNIRFSAIKILRQYIHKPYSPIDNSM